MPGPAATSGAASIHNIATSAGHQSLVFQADGRLFKVILRINNTGGTSSNVTIRAFDGFGPPGGTLIETAVASVPAGTQNVTFYFNNNGFDVYNGQQLYFEVTAPAGPSVFWLDGGNIYAGGTAYYNLANQAARDFYFETFYSPYPTCLNPNPGSTYFGIDPLTATPPLGASAQGEEGYWEFFTAGTGTFSDIRDPNATYTPSCADAELPGGEVRFWWKSTCHNNVAALQSVFVSPIPLNVGPINPTICQGANITLTAGGAPAYLWSTGSTASAINVTPPATTTYTVTGSGIFGGCSYEKTTIVNVTNPPVPDAGSDQSICDNTSATLIGNAVGGTPSYTYAWFNVASGGTALSASQNYVTPVLSPGTYNFYLEVVDANSCSGPRDLVVVTVNPLPVMTSATGIGICSGQTLAFPFTSSIAPASFSWIAADNTNITGESLTSQTSSTLNNTLASSSTVPQNVSYTVSPTASTTGCVGSGQVVIVSVNPVPVMSNVNSSTICSGSSVVIPLTSAVPATYSWIATDNINTNGESLTSQTTSTLNNTINNLTGTDQLVNYSVTPTASTGGCVGSIQTITVTVKALPSLSLSSTNVSCFGMTDGSISAAGVGGTSPYLFSLNGGAYSGSSNFTGLSSGSYTVSVQDALGCVGSPQIVSITQPAALSFVIGGNSTICSGNALGITITPSGGTGAYTSGWLTSPNANTGGESTTSVFSTLINNVITNTTVNIESLTYTVTVTDINACVASNTVIATVFPAPSLTNVLAGSTCSGISFSQILSSNISPATFTWVATPNPNTTGESTAIQNTGTLTEVVTNSTGGSENVLYTIIPTVTATSCSGAPETFTLTVRPLPIISAPNMNTCSGGSVAIPSVPSSGTAPYVTYGWYTASSGGVLLSSLQNYSTGALVAGTYQYFPEVTDNAGCVSTRPLVTVTSYPNPSANAGPDQTVCAGSPATLTAGAIGGTPSYTYAWYDAITGGTLLASTQVFSPTLPTGTYSHFAQITDANGCVSPRDQMVLTVPNPLSGVTGSTNITCFGANNGSINVTPSGGTGPYQFSLNGGAFGIPASFTGLPAGTHTVTIKDNINCTLPLIVSITEPPLLTGSLLSSSPATCNGTTDGSATITQVGGVSAYQYSLNGGPYLGTNTFNSLAAGSYTATVQDANACISNNVIFTITQPPVLSIGNSGSTTVCDNVPLNISLNGVGGTPGYSFSWISNDNLNTTGESLGAVSTALINNTILSSSTAPEALSYTVTLTDANSCVANQIINVSVNPSPTMVSSSSFSVCSGTPMSFGLNANVASTFSWLANDNANTTGESTASQSTANITDLVLNPTIAAEIINYTVTPTSTAGGCIGATQIVVANVNPLPNVSISPSANPICSGGSSVLTASGADTYTWAGSNLSSTNGTPVTATPSTNTTYTVVGTNTSTTCFSNFTLLINVNLPPTASAAGPDQQLCATNTAILAANTPVSGTGIWTIISGAGGGIVSPGNPTSNFNGIAGVSYILRWTISNPSCTDSQDDVSINFNPSPGFTIIAPTTICSGDNLNLGVGSLIGGTTFNYNWSGPGGFNSILANPIRPNILGADGGTYSLNITNEFGCSASNNTNITVLSSPIAIISGGGGSSVCANEMATLDGSTSSANGDVISGYQWFHAGTAMAGATLSTHVNNLSGVYNLEVTNTNGCKDTSLGHILTVETIPTPVIAGNASFCSGSSSLLNAFSSGAGGASVIDNYEWLFNGASVSSGPANDTYLVTAGGNYQLIILNSNGCRDTSAALFLNEMLPPVAPVLSSTGTSYCLNDSLLIAVQTPTAGHTYSWTVNPAVISISSTSGTSNYLGGQVTGSYTVDVIETDLNGCSSSSGSTIVTINTRPTAIASSTNTDTLCYGGSVVLNLAPNSMSSYSWTSSFGATGSAQNDLLSTGTQTGPIMFYGSATNIFGCQSANDTLRFFVANPIIINTASAIVIDATCGQADGSVSGISISADGPLTYAWQNAGGSLGVTTDFINSVVADTYTLTVTNRFGCSDSAVFTINSGPAPTAPTLQSAPTICENQSFALSVVSPIAGATYNWSGPSGFTQSGVDLNSITITNASALNAGPYSVTITQAGCTSVGSAPISAILNQAPVVSISGSTSFCVGGSTLLNAATTVGSASTYQWYLNGGVISGATSATYATNSAGNYNVEIVLLNGCSDSAFAPTNVIVNPLPTVLISPASNTICEGSQLTLTGSGANTYNWSNGSSTNVITFSPTSSVSFNVQGTDANGCINADTVFITVNPKPAIPVASSSSGVECTGTNVTMSSSSSLTNSWYNVASNTNISTLQSFSHTETVSGVYTYGVYVTDANSCNSDTAYANVQFNNCISNLNNEIEFLQANGFVNNNIFTNDGNPVGYTVNTVPVLNPFNGSFTINSSGSYTYTPNAGFSGYDVIVVSACNTIPVCLNDTIFISVGPYAGIDIGTVSNLIPNAQLTGNVLVNDIGAGILGSVTLITNVSHGTLSLSTSGDFVYTPTVNYCGADSFMYQISDVNSFVTYAYCIIDVSCTVQIITHTGFSPNNDGVNDVWVISGIDASPNKVTIYDRWGNEIWDGENYDNTSVVWSGKNKNNEELTAGTYFYMIKVKDQKAVRGWVEITK
ncbi:MAG: PKD-like domain-containing protein [Bacteroidota bacterium]|nr:PKD-like domain-containing protein [Bacteroidota bacterium]